ncbi:Uncharacterized protein DAT39_017038 [Clarias magur]|uniref:Uncharacterized protein n=1 Tax=Clarias magur TaxID=1594786 RepID=A0A8J4UEH3_CLAMG|nr:Uncharacterized protein DAT39_017038 [Clarias magur]
MQRTKPVKLTAGLLSTHFFFSPVEDEGGVVIRDIAGVSAKVMQSNKNSGMPATYKPEDEKEAFCFQSVAVPDFGEQVASHSLCPAEDATVARSILVGFTLASCSPCSHPENTTLPSCLAQDITPPLHSIGELKDTSAKPSLDIPTTAAPQVSPADGWFVEEGAGKGKKMGTCNSSGLE